MSHWEVIRQMARERREELVLASGGKDSAEALLDAAARVTGVSTCAHEANDLLLAGADAVLDVAVNQIRFNRDLAPGLRAYFLLHEYAHHWLHRRRFVCSGVDVEAGAHGDIALGVRRVEGYSPEERQEREANVFAREVLLPAALLRRWFLRDGLHAPEIAERVGVIVELVHHQLAHAIFVDELTAQPNSSSVQSLPPPLDASQRDAAEWTQGPLLVEAGPGTGKTRTLVGRICFLLDRGTDPGSIVALTFSNKAAAEIRERVAVSRPNEAPRIWMGTFHAFGLELLRKFGDRLGLSATPTVADPVDALFILEKLLPSLKLNHHQNLYEPGLTLRDILRAVSRAKDELVNPQCYHDLAREMLANAGGDDERIAAEKALEVAGAYQVYQEALANEGALDFGDLISRSVTLLREHTDVRDAIRAKHKHVMVDEYQDVNHACTALLVELAGEAHDLWVVGDIRQAIYRFRGAAPRNVRQFTTTFPGAQTRALRVNYRSRPAIVDTVGVFARTMRATRGLAFEPWEVQRREANGSVAMEIAEDATAEALGIARKIGSNVARGVTHRNQAVLCRSHSSLARIAEVLEEMDVPILYLGNLFERPEVRDLLALLELTCAGRGRGLVRVASFPEYRIPRADVLTFLRAIRQGEQWFPDALRLAETIEGISDEGRRGFALLAGHLDGVAFQTNAWRFLVEYLFVRSQFLAQNLSSPSAQPGRQQRLAIYQLLAFAHDLRTRFSPGAKVPPRRAFLAHIRRLELYGEERELRRVPDWAEGIDAVRLLTVHASKGLEFDAVYLPGLRVGGFPVNRHGETCPPPVGLIAADPEAHEEEEECIFFVGLSRAREQLTLSRAASHGKAKSNPSPFLADIRDCLPRDPRADPTWLGVAAQVAGSSRVPGGGGVCREFDARDLDLYILCPRQYYYEQILELPRGKEDSAYVRFHRVVYKFIAWLGEELRAARRIDSVSAEQRLGELWTELGPADHAYADLYLANARRMVELAIERTSRGRTPDQATSWRVPLGTGVVLLVPDLVQHPVVAGGKPTVTRFRTGRRTASESGKSLYGLYQFAAQRAFPEGFQLEILYLLTNEVEPIALKEKAVRTRLDHYERALGGILAEDFTPKKNERRCPSCPHYFVCPAGPGLGA